MSIQVQEAVHKSARRPQAKYYHHGHSGYVHGNQDLQTTTRYRWFQEALTKIEPELNLGFDRWTGLWCIWKTHLHKVDMEMEGDALSYMHPVPIIVKQMAWARDESGDPVMGPPTDKNLSDIRRDLERGAITVDNGKWAAAYMTKKAEDDWERSQNDAAAGARAVLEDMKNDVVWNEDKFKTQVSMPSDFEGLET